MAQKMYGTPRKRFSTIFLTSRQIEVLLSHLQQNPLQCFLDTFRRERTENSCLHFLTFPLCH